MSIRNGCFKWSGKTMCVDVGYACCCGGWGGGVEGEGWEG